MDITVERMYTCELRIVTMLDIKVYKETRVVSFLSLSLSFSSVRRKKETSSWFDSIILRYTIIIFLFLYTTLLDPLLDIFVSRRVRSSTKILFKEGGICFVFAYWKDFMVTFIIIKYKYARMQCNVSIISKTFLLIPYSFKALRDISFYSRR